MSKRLATPEAEDWRDVALTAKAGWQRETARAQAAETLGRELLGALKELLRVSSAFTHEQLDATAFMHEQLDAKARARAAVAKAEGKS